MIAATVSIVLADPDVLARRSIRAALGDAAGIAVVAEATHAREAVELARYHRPDVLVAEAAQPDLDADDLCVRVAAQAPGTRVVLLCAHEDHEVAVRCLRAGAIGYLAKDADLDSLARVLRGVNDGEAAVSRQLTMALVEALRDVPETGWRPVHSRLTAREWEIVDLLDGGESTDGIAERLVLAQATVYSHIKNVMGKLEVHSRDDAVHAAMRLRREEAALTV
jgi:two-component system nitrate/nitrite response regulator NarL